MGCAIGATLMLAGCAEPAQPTTPAGSPSVSPECLESTAVNRVGQNAMAMPTGTPQQTSSRMAQLEVAFQIVVDHPECFSSEDVAGAKRVLAKTDKP